MRFFLFRFVGLSSFLLTSAIALPAIALETVAQVPSNSSEAVQRLGQMFSPEIQRIVNACWERGKVNLASNAAPTAPLMCGDGSSEAQVSQQTYVDTLSDILAASSLIGFRAVMQSDPRLTPEILRMFVGNSEGMGILRNTIQTAIAQSQLIAPSARASTDLLTDSVIQRLVPVLQDSSGITNLLGNQQQYRQVVQSFCTAPGMPVEQARSQVPGLNSLQLYAICIQESGVTREITPQPRSSGPESAR